MRKAKRSLPKKKSTMRMETDETTTDLVVELPTPFVPPLVVRPI